MKLKIFIDGASRRNPGPGACAVTISDTKKSVLKETGKFLGECTNNFAEYSALSLALSAAKKLGGTELSIFSDSELLVRQFNGDYKIKKPELRAFMPKILKQVSFFRRVTLAHIPRELNSHTDKLVNRILNRGLACTHPGTASYPQAQKRPGERHSTQLTLPLSRLPSPFGKAPLQPGTARS